MGVTKDVVTNGDGKTYPKRGDKLSMHYTGAYACVRGVCTRMAQYVFPLLASPCPYCRACRTLDAEGVVNGDCLELTVGRAVPFCDVVVCRVGVTQFR